MRTARGSATAQNANMSMVRNKETCLLISDVASETRTSYQAIDSPMALTLLIHSPGRARSVSPQVPADVMVASHKCRQIRHWRV
jgi:hypothetical protein